MTNEEILNKAIEMAVKNGYEVVMSDAISSVIAENKTSPTFEKELNGFSRIIIFSHEFAKAFWGEEENYYIRGELTKDGQDWNDDLEPAWQYHLQQMVLEKEPIKYLEKFIE